MDTELYSVEVVRIQNNYPDAPGLEFDTIHKLEYLCKAFGFGLKTIGRINENEPIYMFEVYYCACSFYQADYQTALKIFLVHNEWCIVSVGSVQMSDDDLVALTDFECF